MSRDQRWTGGSANRAWQSGTQVEPVTDTDVITAGVAAYLTDCKRHQAFLNRDHHPTEDGAVKVVFHQGKAQEQVIREEFRRQTGTRPKPKTSRKDGES